MAGIAPIAASEKSDATEKKPWNLPYATPGLVNGLLYGGLSAGWIMLIKKVVPILKKYNAEMLQLKKELKEVDSFDEKGKENLKKKIKKLQGKIGGYRFLLIGTGFVGVPSMFTALGGAFSAAGSAIATAGVDTQRFQYRKKQSLWNQIFDITHPFEDVLWNDGRKMSQFERDLELAK